MSDDLLQCSLYSPNSVAKDQCGHFSALTPELQRTKEDGGMNGQTEFESCFR